MIRALCHIPDEMRKDVGTKTPYRGEKTAHPSAKEVRRPRWRAALGKCRWGWPRSGFVIVHVIIFVASARFRRLMRRMKPGF